jgi:3'-phosphoadenosine 5'-phosphosulfate sulfotransferase (PAPS reductase)/FAD synthetase
VFTKLGDEWREREKKRIVTERRDKSALLFPGAKLSRKEEKALENVPLKSMRPCRILDIEGLRGQESTGREKQPVLMYREDASTESNEVWRWLPVHRFSTDDIWKWIAKSGVPFHPAYSMGLERLSCVSCLYAPPHQLQAAGKANRDLLRRYVEKEEKYGMAFTRKVSLKQVEADIVAGNDYEKSGAWGDCAPQL